MRRITSLLLIFMLAMVTMAGCAPKEPVNQDAQAFLEETENTVAPEEASEEANKEAEPAADQAVPEEPIVVKVGVPAGVTAMSMLGAMREEERGPISFEFDIIPTPDLIAAKLINKEVDFIVLPTNLASILYNKGVEYKLAGSSIWGTLYMISSEEITDWADLKGKEIYTIGRGLTPDVMLRYLLENKGINPDEDVTITYLSGATELAPTFISGRSTVSVIPEPMLSAVLMKKPEANVVFDFQKEWAGITGTGESYPQASVMVQNAFVEAHPQAVQAVLAEFERSAKWINEDTEAAGAFAETLDMGLKKAIVVNAVERSNIRFVGVEEAKPEIETYLSVLMDASEKLIGGKMPDEAFYFAKPQK